ncbi:YbaN family protein [Celerinatantimonas yamalensis]|uniref:Inner membrane protein n=1 Tax=Celerinatantimonas yamalensis TaxID=559956 RepID=A0ABW9G8V4_9GAMM
MVRILLIIVGWLAVILGALGVILPLLPTTPFLLLACLCFSKASPRFEQWLLNHRYFGVMIQNWRQYRVIPVRAKCVATMMLVISAVGIGFTAMPWLGRILVWCMLATILLFITTRRSKVPRLQTTTERSIG